ncbi:nuclear envelope pore membrane protein POM 121-like [Manis pentadactyla]|uniref:nuclear envelope pore membrane protein POM 121-like n=1 Tax=Manis pentadactyla TaxID=143292 RepID=UPI00255CFFA4|nr:nuclear envelope pore membrane protein POM 121-like [Manis pentadactyla]
MAVTGSVCCLVVIPEWCAGLRQAAQIPKAPDPWSKEAVLLALERWKRKKRTVEEEEEQTSVAGQEDKRRCHDSSGSGHSAFKPEVANGVRAAFVPEPGRSHDARSPAPGAGQDAGGGRGEGRALRRPSSPGGGGPRFHGPTRSLAGSYPRVTGSCGVDCGRRAGTGASASPGVLRPDGRPGELPAVAEPLRGLGWTRHSPGVRGPRQDAGCPGCRALAPSDSARPRSHRRQVAGLTAPPPRELRVRAAGTPWRPPAVRLTPRAVPAAAAATAAGKHTGCGGGRERPPPQLGRQASLRLNQRSGRGIPVPHPSPAQPRPSHRHQRVQKRK